MQAHRSDVGVLFEPINLCSMSLRNRIAMAPMTRRLSPGGVPNADVANYYSRRAQGGVGLIFTEGTLIDHRAAGGFENVPHFFGESAIDGWRRVVDAVHAGGSAIVPQLWHLGNVRKKGMPPDPNVIGMGPEDIFDGDELVVQGMSESQMAEVSDSFAEAAYRAVQLGFDGVAIHGAHGYLLDQFHWDKMNRRSDGFGGSLANRLRLSSMITRAVRDSVGEDFPVIYRFSQWKIQDYSARIIDNENDLMIFTETLARSGVDIFDVSTRRFWEPWNIASSENLASATRRVSNKSVIAVGSVGVDSAFSAAQVRGDESLKVGIANCGKAIESLKNLDFDCIALGRALLADPDWPKKVREGDFDKILPFRKDMFSSLA